MVHAGGELNHTRVSLRGGVHRELIRKPREHHVAQLRKRPIRWREEHQLLFDPERVTRHEIIVPPRPQRLRAITITDNLVSVRASAQDSHPSSLVCAHAIRNKACTPDSSRPTRTSCEHLVKPLFVRPSAAPTNQRHSCGGFRGAGACRSGRARSRSRLACARAPPRLRAELERRSGIRRLRGRCATRSDRTCALSVGSGGKRRHRDLHQIDQRWFEGVSVLSTEMP